MKSYRMQDMTFPEVKEYLKTNKTIIIPYALSEQHGAHLPLHKEIRSALVYAYLSCKGAWNFTYRSYSYQTP